MISTTQDESSDNILWEIGVFYLKEKTGLSGALSILLLKYMMAILVL